VNECAQNRLIVRDKIVRHEKKLLFPTDRYSWYLPTKLIQSLNRAAELVKIVMSTKNSGATLGCVPGDCNGLNQESWAMSIEGEADPFFDCLSLSEESWREAQAERWIRSHEAGRDLGNCIIEQWVHAHWPGFLRARWLDHLLGLRFWSELDRTEFGLLTQTPAERMSLLNEIVAQLRRMAENLDVIRWACAQKSPEDQLVVHDLLLIIDVNSRRMRCRFLEQ